MIDPRIVWDNYGLDSLQQGLEELFPEYDISLNQFLEQIFAGNIIEGITGLMKSAVMGLSGYVDSVRNILIWLLILGIAASLITHFIEIFDKHQIADLSFFFLYLLFVTVLLKCFQETAQVAAGLLENIVLFMQLMIPTYMLAVGVSAGVGTASLVYQIMIGLIYLAESFLKNFLIPLVHIYLMLVMMNGVWVEEKLGLLIKLVEKAIGTLLKAAVGAVTGVSIFQSLITPVISSLKSTALRKFVSAIPGIGGAAEGMIELALGAASVIKNSIGLICLILLMVICAAPLLYLFFLAWALRLAAAILGIVSDKRLTACTNQIGEACMMLCRIAGTGVVLFLISVSVVALSTGRGM